MSTTSSAFSLNTPDAVNPTGHLAPSRVRSGFALLGCFALAFGAARLGSTLTTPNLGWYAELQKPWFTPPDWAFPVAWTILFAMMAVSMFLAWRALGLRMRFHRALAAFAVQLALNVAWSAAFFATRDPALGVAVIAALAIAIVWTIFEFSRLSGGAALLLVPYLLWVGYAALLNISIWWLNAA
jgi:translocator protein